MLLLSPLALAYSTGLTANLAALVLLALSKRQAGLWLFRIGVAVLAAAVFIISWQAWRPPMYGLFETMVTVSFIAGLCGLLGRGVDADRVWPWVAGLIVVLLLIGMPRPKVPGLDFFMYGSPYTVGFFFLRLLAMGFLIYAALAFLSSLSNPDQRQALTWRGRNYLLVGSALFLGGEMSGSWWALNWMGDFWLWGRGFLMSTLMFLCAMFAFHIPAGLAGRPRLAAALGAMPGVVVLISTIVAQLAEGV
jgi:hypothetical protein